MKHSFHLKLPALILSAVLFLASGILFAQHKSSHDLAVEYALNKAYDASVRIWGIDSVNHQQNSAQFSGVVVTSDGYILTAAHAISSGNIYLVNFPSGVKAKARAMGRMAIGSLQGRPDLGMLKIIEKGSYSHTDMGDSDQVAINDLCISVAYPTTLSKAFPTVRVGVVTRPVDQWGFMISTCKMEPGDSGGGLFDGQGRLIAIHSRIDSREEINYECPVNLFREHWTSLSQQINYVEIPSQKDVLPESSSEETLFNLDRRDLPSNESTVLAIRSSMQNKNVHVLGTHVLVPSNVSSQDKYSWVVSKSSMVGDSAIVKDIDGKEFTADIFARNDSIDLVLLRITKIRQNAIDLRLLSDTGARRIWDIGITLFSDIRSRKEISALSAKAFRQEKATTGGYFGAMAKFIDQKILISSFGNDSPAKIAGLMLNDQISMINGVTLTHPEHYGRELRKYGPGDTTIVKGYRNGAAFELSVLLTEIPFQGNHPAYHFEGGRSKRFDGFGNVFPHDGKITPMQAGSPVFTEDGIFVGLNIARFSRTCTLAIPADIVINFIISERL